jgi:predicted ATPase
MTQAGNVAEAVTMPAPRVTRLRVSNYRSLSDDVVIDFGDLTVFVGPNGSGKSNVLDVFRFLREALTFGLEPAVARRLGITRLRRVAPTKPRAIKLGIDLSAPDWTATYELQLNASKGGAYKVERESLRIDPTNGDDDGMAASGLVVDRGRVVTAPAGTSPRGSDAELVLPSLAGHPLVRPVVEALRAVRVHSIYPRELSQPQPIGVAPPLDDTGSNWCAVLRTMPPASLRELTLGLERVTGDITDLRVDSAGGFYTAEFEHKLQGVSRWFSAGQESDGTLRLAGILTALLQDPLPPVLGIEEPELTINPGLLPLLYDYLRATSRRCQLILTTHSPDLLDMLDMEDVRVVDRVDGASRVGGVDEAQRLVVRDSLMSPGGLLRSGGLRVAGSERNLLDLLDEED